MMTNYDKMQEAARRRFLTYDIAVFRDRLGLRVTGESLRAQFLGETAEISLKTGHIRLPSGEAGFHESLCLYDWLCDGVRDARASREFAPVSSLPGVLLRGSGLDMHTQALAGKIMAKPRQFARVCRDLGGKPYPAGDLGFEIPLFADLTMVLKFYFGDEEFPPGLTLLWDKNILKYIRYETVYYLAGCVEKRLERGMAPA